VAPFPIDLPTAFRLADAQNPQIQFARERILAAGAELDRASVLWIPSLTLGSQWTRHDGQIQQVTGGVITVSRSALFAGAGAAARTNLADAIFEPLAARQALSARVATEQVTLNSTLLTVAFAYWQLVRARAALTISEETLETSRRLDELAQSYLKVEKLKPADAERIRTELRIRMGEMEAAREACGTASIRLAQLLRLDPFVKLEPVDDPVLPVTLVLPDSANGELAALALGSRPELAESQALVRLAQERLRQANYAPLLPSVVLGYQAGLFGGGPNSFVGNFDGRSDADIALVWEFKSFGLGDRALRQQRESEVRQAQIRSVAEMDRVVAEVADSLNHVKARRLQMDSARQAVESATRSVELNYRLYREGGIDLIRPIEVLQSIQAQVRARQDYLATIIEYNRAQFQIYWALGYPVQSAPEAAEGGLKAGKQPGQP
jgi:outer membrane protein TolC